MHLFRSGYIFFPILSWCNWWNAMAVYPCQSFAVWLLISLGCSLLLYAKLWVWMGQRMPLFCRLRCCLVSSWMLFLLLSPIWILHLSGLADKVVLLWLHSCWCSCPSSLPFRENSRLLCFLEGYIPWLLSVCLVTVSVSPWCRQVHSTHSAHSGTGISLC